jgi:hypothetical protein
MDDLKSAWQDFVRLIGGYGGAASSLNGPCPPETLRRVEDALGFELPGSLAELLGWNNGQKLDRKGLFKSISGWDVYLRPVFLDAESIVTAYRRLIRDETLREELGEQEVPFAAANRPESFFEVFSVNRQDQRVSLLWTCYDPLMPPDWQISRFARGRDLTEFVRSQIRLYK